MGFYTHSTKFLALSTPPLGRSKSFVQNPPFIVLSALLNGDLHPLHQVLNIVGPTEVNPITGQAKRGGPAVWPIAVGVVLGVLGGTALIVLLLALYVARRRKIERTRCALQGSSVAVTNSGTEY